MNSEYYGYKTPAFHPLNIFPDTSSNIKDLQWLGLWDKFSCSQINYYTEKT